MQIPRWFLSIVFIHATVLTVAAIGVSTILLTPQSYSFNTKNGTFQYILLGTKGVHEELQDVKAISGTNDPNSPDVPAPIQNSDVIKFQNASLKNLTPINYLVALTFIAFGWIYIYVLMYVLISIFAGMKLFKSYTKVDTGK